MFENTKVSKILGTNLAILLIASSLFPAESVSFTQEENNKVEFPVVLATEKGIRYLWKM